jgi:hypothetical protein
VPKHVELREHVLRKSLDGRSRWMLVQEDAKVVREHRHLSAPELGRRPERVREHDQRAVHPPFESHPAHVTGGKGWRPRLRKYADDDLIVGSVDPFELFRIMAELTHGDDLDRVALMIDQSHNIEGKIDAMVQSVVNIQTAYAKALLVDRERLAVAQRAGDVLGAHRILLEAFETDVRPLLARYRERKDLPIDPVSAFREGGYAEQRTAERGIASVESAYEQG